MYWDLCRGIYCGLSYINPTATSRTLSWRAKLEKPFQALEARWEAFCPEERRWERASSRSGMVTVVAKRYGVGRWCVDGDGEEGSGMACCGAGT